MSIKASMILIPALKPGDRFEIRVRPGASRNNITRDDTGVLKVSVTTVPENGKANAAVIKLLSKALGHPKSRLKIVRGQTSPDKLIELLE